MQLEKYKDVVDMLFRTQLTLEAFMTSTRMLGFDKMTDGLGQAHNIIGQAIALLREAVAEDVEDRFQAAKEASENMLATGLAGIELGKIGRMDDD